MCTVLTHILHVLSKGMRIAVRSGSIQRCRRTIRGVWVLANLNAQLRSRAQQGEGGINHGLVGTRLSWVNHVLFENISWEESRFLNPRKSKTHPKIMKLGMVSRHGTYMSRNFFRPFWCKFYYKPLTNRSFYQRKPRGSDREMCPPYGGNDNHCLVSPCIFFYWQHGTTGYPCWNLNLFRVRLAFLYTNWVS